MERTVVKSLSVAEDSGTGSTTHTRALWTSFSPRMYRGRTQFPPRLQVSREDQQQQANCGLSIIFQATPLGRDSTGHSRGFLEPTQFGKPPSGPKRNKTTCAMLTPFPSFSKTRFVPENTHFSVNIYKKKIPKTRLLETRHVRSSTGKKRHKRGKTLPTALPEELSFMKDLTRSRTHTEHSFRRKKRRHLNKFLLHIVAMYMYIHRTQKKKKKTTHARTNTERWRKGRSLQKFCSSGMFR